MSKEGLTQATRLFREAVINNYIKFTTLADLCTRIGRTPQYQSALSAVVTINEEKARNLPKLLQRTLEVDYGIDFHRDTAQQVGDKINAGNEPKGGTPSLLTVDSEEFSVLVNLIRSLESTVKDLVIEVKDLKLELKEQKGK